MLKLKSKTSNGRRTKCNSVFNYTSENKIGRPRSGSSICLSRQTELDDTKSYYHLIIEGTTSEERQIARLWTKGTICITMLLLNWDWFINSKFWMWFVDLNYNFECELLFFLRGWFPQKLFSKSKPLRSSDLSSEASNYCKRNEGQHSTLSKPFCSLLVPSFPLLLMTQQSILFSVTFYRRWVCWMFYSWSQEWSKQWKKYHWLARFVSDNWVINKNYLLLKKCFRLSRTHFTIRRVLPKYQHQTFASWSSI